MTVVTNAAGCTGSTASVMTVMMAACTLRVSMLVSTWLHEAAHLAAALALSMGYADGLSQVTLTNLNGRPSLLSTMMDVTIDFQIIIGLRSSHMVLLLVLTVDMPRIYEAACSTDE